MCWQGDLRGEEGDLRRYRRSIVAHVCAFASSDLDVCALEQIVGELLSNVYRYTPGVFCAETWWDDHGGVTLVVHDRGTCFDPEQAFDADVSSEHGRGLAIIRALGGTIDVVPAEHGGCTVSVRLPASQRRDREPEQTTCPQGHPYSRDRHCPRLAGATAAVSRVAPS